MKKLLLKIVLSVFAAVTMAGCIDMNITADVEEKGDITGSMRLLVHPNVLKMMNMTVDEAMEQLKENYAAEYPDATVDKISEERDGTVFEGVELHNVQNDDFTAETKDGIMTVTIPVRELRDQAEDLAGVSAKTLKNYGSVITLVVNMPAEPQTNIGTVEGNTVIIDILNLPDGIDDAIITCAVETEETVPEPEEAEPETDPVQPAEEPEKKTVSPFWLLGETAVTAAVLAIIVFALKTNLNK